MLHDDLRGQDMFSKRETTLIAALIFFLKWLSNTHPFYRNLDVKSASIKKIRSEVIPMIIVTLICVV